MEETVELVFRRVNDYLYSMQDADHETWFLYKQSLAGWGVLTTYGAETTPTIVAVPLRYKTKEQALDVFRARLADSGGRYTVRLLEYP